MLIFKKLFFALPFIFSFSAFLNALGVFFQNTGLVLAFNTTELNNSLTLLAFLLSSSLFFTIFVSLANDWRIVLPVTTLAAAIPILFFATPLSLILALGSLICLIAIFLSLKKQLATYLTFKPSAVLSPSIKQLVTLILLISTLSFYMVTSANIQKNGFEVPDSLIDLSLKFVPDQGAPEQAGQEQSTNMSALTSEQIQLLKQNPELLKQYGLTPDMLDQIANKQKSPKQTVSAKELAKPLIKKQIQDIISPNVQIITIALAAIFFLGLNWLSSLLSLFLSPLLWFIFWLLEKTSFIHFEVEMREVKKLVV